jgi:hypothetical protein
MTIYVNRADMTGTERTFANAYVPGEDIIRYNRDSRVYDVKVGDYALVTAKNHEENEITVCFESGRTLTYNPQRLSGVSVYREANREFAEGDRIQFRTPFAEKRITNGELATIAKIGDKKMTVKLDSGREVVFDSDKFRHIDHGYAVTSHSSQGTTVDRVLINADTRESEMLLNDRMGYVAISRAREDAIIYTNSIEELRSTIGRRVDKEMAVEALNASRDYLHQQRDANSSDPSLTQEQYGIKNELTDGDLEIDREPAFQPEIAQVEEMQFEIA